MRAGDGFASTPYLKFVELPRNSHNNWYKERGRSLRMLSEVFLPLEFPCPEI